MSLLNKFKAHLPISLGGDGTNTRLGAGRGHATQDPFASKEDEAGIVQGRNSSRPRPSWASDDGTSRFNLAARGAQVFFSFIGLCIYIALAAFQSKWNVGPSFMTGFGLTINCLGLVAGGILLGTPLLSDRWRFLRGLERVYGQPRVAVVLNGFVVLLLFAAVIASTVSSQSGGCKDQSQDAHASLEGYLEALGGFCRNKRAGAAFFWLSLISWCASLSAVLYSWYLIRKYPQSSAFAPPRAQDYDDEAFDARAADGDLTTSAASPYRQYEQDNDHAEAPAPGYRPSFGGDSYPYYDDQQPQQAPEYDAGYRDPFEDSPAGDYGYPEGEDQEARDRRRRYEAADPYDAIRQSMESSGRPAAPRY